MFTTLKTKCDPDEAALRKHCSNLPEPNPELVLAWHHCKLWVCTGLIPPPWISVKLPSVTRIQDAPTLPRLPERV